MFRVAALAAALGTALVSVMYAINNVIPILENLQLVAPAEVAIVFLNTIVPSIMWTLLFLACWRASGPRPSPAIAWSTLALAVAAPGLYQASQQLPYFSFLAVDSMIYLLSGLLLPLTWAVLLVRMARAQRPGIFATAALLLTALASIPEVLTSGSAVLNAAAGGLDTFRGADGYTAFWRLAATPVIRLLYWASQLLFLAVLRRA